MVEQINLMGWKEELLARSWEEIGFDVLRLSRLPA